MNSDKNVGLPGPSESEWRIIDAVRQEGHSTRTALLFLVTLIAFATNFGSAFVADGRIDPTVHLWTYTILLLWGLLALCLIGVSAADGSPNRWRAWALTATMTYVPATVIAEMIIGVPILIGA